VSKASPRQVKAALRSGKRASAPTRRSRARVTKNKRNGHPTHESQVVFASKDSDSDTIARDVAIKIVMNALEKAGYDEDDLEPQQLLYDDLD
jgi:hypothetical protein